MKRCIFYVPQQMLATMSVLAETEAEAWAKLLANKDVEQMSLVPGTTRTGKPELVSCLDIAPKKGRGRKRREK